MRAAVAMSPRATSPPDTEARKMLARPVDSEMVCERAPWRVKCSVVTSETVAAVGARADGSPSAMDTGSSHDDALWIRVLWCRGVGARRVGLRSLQRPTRAHAADPGPSPGAQCVEHV